MCPAAERHMRTATHTLAEFELVPGAGYCTNAKLAVKKYTRSGERAMCKAMFERHWRMLMFGAEVSHSCGPDP